jgi:SlyX protein
MPDDLADRVEQLEMRIAFGERTTDELNSVVTEQWREIERLRRELDRLMDRLAQLEATSPSEDEPPPPHY